MFILEARGTRSSQSSQGPRAAASWWLSVKKLGAGAVGIVWLCSLCLWKGTWKEEGSGRSLHPGVDLPPVCHTDAKAPGAFGNPLCIGLWCHT